MGSAKQIDINCDVGEHPGTDHDVHLMPLISSCNIACGGHVGDRASVEATVRAALAQGVAIGAHPSYPDRTGFGRQAIEIGTDPLLESLLAQIQLVVDGAAACGGEIAHIKPHGALYNVAADCERTSECIVQAARQAAPDAKLFGLAGSVTEQVARGAGVAFVPEAFADRRYLANGRLRPRAEPGAVIHDPLVAAEQAVSIARDAVVACGETQIPVQVRTLCVHGDNQQAVEILMAINRRFEEEKVARACP